VLHCGVLLARRLLVAAILAICIGGPIVETFDQWDHTGQDGNDTEANLIIVALCVGLALSFARTICARVIALSSTPHICPDYTLTFHFNPPSFAAPAPSARPPTPLRV
jgi:hypothetical protein